MIVWLFIGGLMVPTPGHAVFYTAVFSTHARCLQYAATWRLPFGKNCRPLTMNRPTPVVPEDARP